jgi:YgiT-type zinc finger domain-containing protein
MSEPDTISRSNACYECHAGIMQPRHLTYFTWLGEELITVPHFPAWICDVCGKREYDEKAIQWLNMLLDPGRPPRTAAARRLPPVLIMAHIARSMILN